MSISLNQHKAHVTKRIIASFSDSAPVKAGLSAFFPSETTIEKMVGIEVERNRQLIAVDVQRSTDPNRNTFQTHAEKLFIPPYFNEAWDFTSAQRYDVTFGAKTNPSRPDALNMIREAARRMQTLREKIMRSIELMRSQAIQTGIVTLVNGDNIDFKRKALSMPVLSGGALWSAPTTATPLADLSLGCQFLREEGLSSGNNVQAIMGQDAFSSFMNIDEIKERANFRRISKLELNMPQFNDITGLVFHGQIATADYVVNLWTYNEFYETTGGVKTKYIDTKNVILIPEDFKGVTAYAGLPAIIRDKSNAEYGEFISPVEAEFYINNYIDPVKKAHWFEIASAPLPIPVSIDRLYTIKTLA